MTSKTKILLLSSAASMIVVTAPGRSLQAADMPVVKAAPVDYVERCTQYGNGWIRYPGTAYCIKLSGKTSLGIDTTGRRDALSLVQNTKDTHYTQTFEPRAQQDAFGLTTGTVNFGAQTRTQTSYGTLASSAQFGFGQASGLEGGTLKTAGPIGASFGPTFKNSNAVFGGSISYSWGPLGQLQAGRITGEYVYMATNDLSNSYGIGTNKTLHILYQWNSSGTSNDPVGWTLNFSAEDPASHKDSGGKGLDGNPCAVPLGANPAGCNGFGGVTTQQGPFRFPEIVPNIRWLDDEIGSAFYAFDLHSIDKEAISTTPAAFGIGGVCNGPGTPPGILLGSCTNGQVVHAVGWGNMYALHLNLPKEPGNAPFARDYILTELTFGKGGQQPGGFTASKRVRSGNGVFHEGGLQTDDADAIAVALPGGGFKLEKESFAVWNFDYRHYLTSCTDPDWCWNMHLSSSLGWVRPGVIARNTDWTKGGVGNFFGQYYEFGLHYGVAELNMEVEADITWSQHRQDLAHDPGAAPTVLPPGISPNGGTWAVYLTFARNFGGALGKALSGF